MDKILEGDVGRVVKFEGKEYWFKEQEPLEFPRIDYSKDLETDYLNYYRHFLITIPPNPKIIGLMEA
jgi:hypothetical protein